MFFLHTKGIPSWNIITMHPLIKLQRIWFYLARFLSCHFRNEITKQSFYISDLINAQMHKGFVMNATPITFRVGIYIYIYFYIYIHIQLRDNGHQMLWTYPLQGLVSMNEMMLNSLLSTFSKTLKWAFCIQLLHEGSTWMSQEVSKWLVKLSILGLWLDFIATIHVASLLPTVNK